MLCFNCALREVAVFCALGAAVETKITLMNLWREYWASQGFQVHCTTEL